MTSLVEKYTVDDMIDESYVLYCEAKKREFMDDLMMKGRMPYAFPISDYDARRHVEEMQEAHMVEALHSLCTLRSVDFSRLEGQSDSGENAKDYRRHLESRVLMKETHDHVKEIEYNHKYAFTRKSLTYLDTYETNKISSPNRKGNLHKKRFKTRNPYTLRIYRDEDQFEQILEMENKTSELIREQLMLRLRYMDLFKKWQGASIDEVYEEDPRFQYLFRCQQHLNLALPLLDKVRGKTLCLYDYTLDIGHCKALAIACQLFDKSINRVLFDNCGIDDMEFSAILQGLDKLQDFKSIVYKRNIFDKLSLEAIKPLL